MSQEPSLQDLILGYCQQVGGLVEPPAYGIYEVLLPDDVAARWGFPAHQRFLFAEEEHRAVLEGSATQGSVATEGSAATLLHYGHPLVETVVEELRRQSANGLFFVNNVRLEKPGLFSVIEKAVGLPNAKLFPVPDAVERRRLYHYVRFNFKASLIADEKRELILPIWMHLQSGYAVKSIDIERLAVLDVVNQFKHLDPADLAWLPKPPANPLSEEVLHSLLERARLAARIALGDTLQSLEKRLRRFLELDHARLSQYYDDLQKDAEKRLQKADADHRPALEAKLSAIETERQAKLADVVQKYRLRVDLELVNLAVIAQPKLDLKVEIKKRTAASQRQVAWDPLRHTVEPLACDICGLPGEELHLCENGHLAHAACLAPQCVECKRTFCQKCAESLQNCVVCARPVCVHSLARCPECQRVTCHEHVNLCHAANGEPQRIQAASPEAAASLEKAAPAAAPVPTPHGAELAARRKAAKKRGIPKARTTSVKKPVAGPTGDYVDIYFGAAKPLVSAYVMVKKREIAVRSWELTDGGIAVYCQCGNWYCREDGLVYRPAPDGQIEAQIMSNIRELMAEYHVPEKKLHFYRVVGEAVDARRLILTGRWKDPAALEAARTGFDNLK